MTEYKRVTMVTVTKNKEVHLVSMTNYLIKSDFLSKIIKNVLLRYSILNDKNKYILTELKKK